MESSDYSVVVPLVDEVIARMNEKHLTIQDCMAFCEVVAAITIKSCIDEDHWKDAANTMGRSIFDLLQVMRDINYEVAGINVDQTE